MKHEYFTAVFALCLAVTITVIPVRASEAPQGETPEAVTTEAAEEENAFVGDEAVRTDTEEESETIESETKESGETTIQKDDFGDFVNEAGETAQEEAPAEEAAQEEALPAEEADQEEAAPAEEADQEEAVTAEEAAQEEAVTAEEAAQEEALSAEEAAQEGTKQDEEVTQDAAQEDQPQTSEQISEAAVSADGTLEEMNAAAGMEAAAAESTIDKKADTSAASGQIRQMKLEVIDFNGQGYGDSQMLTSGGKKLLIDTYVKESWGPLNNWLNNHGYYDFDIYISHYHDDHMGNIRNILNDGKYKVSNLYLPVFSYMNGDNTYMQDYIEWCQRIIDAAKDKGVKITYLQKGSSFTLGDVNATVLWGAQYKSSEHKRVYINNNSLVTRFTCGNTRYLNAGDIEVDTEKQILNAKVDVKADIYKLSHHGIDDTNSNAFLKAVGASFYYYNSLEDNPSEFSVEDSMTYHSAQNAKKYGNVASVRYNGDITYTVYNDIISQVLQRNYTEQKVYLYDKKDSKKLKGVVTQKLNNATTKYIDDRAYDGYSSASSKRAGTYAEDGWILGNTGEQYYYKNNEPLTGWKKIDGYLYHFNEKTGKKDTGWKKYGGYTFYFSGAGRAKIGNAKIGKSLYHFDENARLVEAGWAKTDGRWCYVSPRTGTVLTGFKKISGKLYYFDSTGYLLNHVGFVKVGRKVFYECKDGSMKTGWLKVDGKMYYMNADGSRHTGWLKKNGKLFHFESDGAMTAEHGFIRIGKEKVFYECEDGSMKIGWLKVNGKLYYMNADGSMHTGWLKAGKKMFYFGADGVLTRQK